MFPTATVELALTLVNSAISLGHRIDDIRLKAVMGEGLPFSLPPLPDDFSDLRLEMEEFFQTEAGKEALQIDGLFDEFRGYLEVSQNPAADPGPDFVSKQRHYIRLYSTLNGKLIRKVGDDLVPPPDQTLQLSLGYYLVDSAKPGTKRSTFVDVALATADVALEFVGANPGYITRNEEIQEVLSTFLQKFTAGKLEDLATKQIFERTLSSVILTAIDKRELMKDQEPLSLFLETLSELKDKDPDFVADLIAGRGLENLLQGVLQTAGQNIHRFTDNEVLKETLGGFLSAVAEEEFFGALRFDQDSLALLAQVAIAQVARYPNLVEDREGKPLWNAVVRLVLQEIQGRAEARKLFESESLAAIVQTALEAVANDPDLLDKGFAGKLVTGVAEALSQESVTSFFTTASLRVIAARALAIAAEHPELLVHNDEFTQKVLGAVLAAGSEGFKGELDEDFAMDIFSVAIDAVYENVELLDLSDFYADLLSGVMREFSSQEIKGFLLKRNLPEAMRRTLGAIVANPQVWQRFGNGKIPVSVLRTIAEVIAADPTGLLRGEVLMELIEGTLEAVARRAKAYAKVVAGTNPNLFKLLTEVLAVLNEQLGVKLGADNIVPVLVELVLDWGEKPFTVDATTTSFQEKVEAVLKLAA